MLGTEDFGAGGTVRGFDSFTWAQSAQDGQRRTLCLLLRLASLVPRPQTPLELLDLVTPGPVSPRLHCA